jgi:hypothetical protein
VNGFVTVINVGVIFEAFEISDFGIGFRLPVDSFCFHGAFPFLWWAGCPARWWLLSDGKTETVVTETGGGFGGVFAFLDLATIKSIIEIFAVYNEHQARGCVGFVRENSGTGFSFCHTPNMVLEAGVVHGDLISLFESHGVFSFQCWGDWVGCCVLCLCLHYIPVGVYFQDGMLHKYIPVAICKIAKKHKESRRRCKLYLQSFPAKMQILRFYLRICKNSLGKRGLK